MIRSGTTIEALGGEIEELIKLNGVFKLIGQGTAQDVVEDLAAAPGMASLERHTVEGRMRKQKDGSFSTTLDLATDREYQFRYLIDGEIWISDPEADKFAFSPFGDCENSVVTV